MLFKIKIIKIHYSDADAKLQSEKHNEEMLSRRKRNFHATSSHSNTDLCLVEEHKITWKIFIEQYICDAIHSMVKDYCHGRKNPCLTCSNNGLYSGMYY